MKKNFLVKLGDFIVNFRYLFLGLFVVLAVICTININNVKVNYDITSYLPDDTETKVGIDLMKEFGELNQMQVLLTDISYDDAQEKADKIKNIDNVENVSFNNTKDYYKNNNALIVVELGNVSDNTKDKVLSKIDNIVDDSEYYIYVENSDDAVGGMNTILIIVVIIIVAVLLFTSKSYFNVILAFIVFGISILLNMGSNFLLGEISYITKSIAIVLQLGLSLDYLIIFLNHYMKEVKDDDNLILAVKKTVTKSVKEIFASSLTTIAGLIALVFMQLKIGGDIGIVMSKGIVCSMLTVILLLPCLLIIFNKPIMKLEHKSFVPNTKKLSQIILKSRKVLLSLFIIIVLLSIYLMGKYSYVYNVYSVKSITKSDTQIALDKIESNFGKHNRLVILVENKDKDYNKELELFNELSKNQNILSMTSIGSQEIGSNIYLGSKLDYNTLSQILNITPELSLNLYKYYASENNELDKLININDYKITVIDLIYFLKDNKDKLPLDDDMKLMVDNYYNTINNSIAFLESDNYSRFILELKTDVEGEETFELLDDIKDVTNKYYDSSTLVGESVSARDLSDTFSHDNLIITLITIVFIALILLFSFKSLGMTLLLILTIEGSILINFGITTLIGDNIFFMSYIVVSAIQMGATIDYAIVMSNRYLTLRNKMDKKEAMIGALTDSTPAIITSGLILTASGFLIGFISDSGVISSIGMALGCGTLISMICTIFILPAILHVCDKFIKITTFTKK